MKKSIVILSLLALAACAAHKLLPVQSDADRAAQKFPGTTLADLNEGKSMYETNCQKCHGLKNPKSFSEEKWDQIVPVMAKKAKVDEHTEDLIHRYVVTMATRP